MLMLYKCHFGATAKGAIIIAEETNVSSNRFYDGFLLFCLCTTCLFDCRKHNKRFFVRELCSPIEGGGGVVVEKLKPDSKLMFYKCRILQMEGYKNWAIVVAQNETNYFNGSMIYCPCQNCGISCAEHKPRVFNKDLCSPIEREEV
jgi:hypothetical protein